MIEIKQVTKQYANGRKPALDQVSFKVRNCKVYGLLGPQGAGKTTALSIIAGVTPPSKGTVLINGYDIQKQPLAAKRQIGYLPEEPVLFPDLTPYEYLTFIAEARGVKGELCHAQVKEAIALMGLVSVQDRLIRHFSKSYRRKVGLAGTLLGNPELILLDEPTAGMDARQAMETRSLIRRLGQTKTVIVTSHILSDMIELCDHMVILSEGQVVADGAPDALDTLKPALEDLFAAMTRQADEVPTAEYEDEPDGEAEDPTEESVPDTVSVPENTAEEATDGKEGL